MKLSEFYYDLPKELIAQEPLKERDEARLMVLDRATKNISEKIFSRIKEDLKAGDCLVLNDTRVIPVRLYAKRKTGGKVEIFVLNPGEKKLKALVRPSVRVKDGEKVSLDNGIYVVILGKADIGRHVEFSAPLAEVLQLGHVPLPPYISRPDTSRDAEDYQTVYAQKPGATASPTAGLHFTENLLTELKEKGVIITYVTLHTSYGTFAPVKAEIIENHVMHSEYFEISLEAAEKINKAKTSGGRIVAVGTTSTRVLESSSDENGIVTPSKGDTNIFIYPGYKFKTVDALITNFHIPESTLLMLVSAFAGKEFIFDAYKKAIREKFRFFSYGDAMMIV